MENKNLLRIKVNQFNLFNVKLVQNGRDFNFSFPLTSVKGLKVNTHFSFHTPNDRITFKIISLENNKKEDILQHVVDFYSKNTNLVKKIIPNNGAPEIDLFYGDKFNLKDPNYLVDTRIGIALNFTNTSIEKLFTAKKSKTKDEKFEKVINITVPKYLNKISIKVLAGKNFIGNIENFKKGFDEYVILEERNKNDDKYTFLFLIHFDFPQQKNYKKLSMVISPSVAVT